MTEISNARKILRQLTRRVISFFPVFAEIAENSNAGLFLSQAFYWTEETHNDKDEGWFYKTSKEWTEETSLSRREQDTCRNILVEKGFLAQKVSGFPAKCHFKVDFDAVLNAVSSLPESAKLSGGKRQTSLAESANVSSIEITTESTVESAPEPGALCHTCGAYGKHLCKPIRKNGRQGSSRKDPVQFKTSLERKMEDDQRRKENNDAVARRFMERHSKASS